jgi:tetratricopeptide (TPR) repeat protein
MAAPGISAVDALKNAGNDAFAKGRWDDAISLYTQALDGAPANHVLYSNRAAAYLARRFPGDALNAIADANTAIRLDPSFAKGYHRKSCALIQIGEYEDAAQTCQVGTVRLHVLGPLILRTHRTLAMCVPKLNAARDSCGPIIRASPRRT